MKNYNEVVSMAREVARDALRLKLVNEVRGVILDYSNTIASYEKDDLAIQKNIARKEFAKSQLLEADPDFADKVKACDEAIESFNQSLKYNASSKEKYAALIKKEEERIAKITSGEIKVDANELQSATEVLLGEISTDYAVEKAKALVA